MLHQLVEYARTHLPDSEPGFAVKELRWQVQVSPHGTFLALLPLGDGKRGQQQQCPDMHNMNAGGRAHFLVESAQSLALFFKDENEQADKGPGAEEKHRFFRRMLDQAAQAVPELDPIAAMLSNLAELDRLRAALGEHKAKPTDWIKLVVGGFDPLRSPACREWWRAWRVNDLAEPVKPRKPGKFSAAEEAQRHICLLTGEAVKPVSTHPKIKGLAGVGGLGTGDVIVGFDKQAFGSYGLEQSLNAAMSETAARQYADGLNDLIDKHSRKLAGALVAHWFKEQIKTEDDPLAFLYEPPDMAEASAQIKARELLDAIRAGRRPDLGNNRYFALTLSGASGRVMVRDWMEGSFTDLIASVNAWFEDLSIVARDGQGHAREPKFMAVCGALVRDLKDIPAPTVTQLWRCALARLPIPFAALAQALARVRVDIINDQSMNHARMGLIKAYFIRKKGGQNVMSAYLNEDHPEAAYHCGRLIAVLANLQRAALGDVGAGVVQRYYAASSQAPALVMGRLITNSKNHLNKLDGGLPFWYENKIAGILSHIKDRVPRTLDLEEQSLFALGYYQQLAYDRQGKGKRAESDNSPAN
jgi:CRISPR-associated protein Csd1